MIAGGAPIGQPLSCECRGIVQIARVINPRSIAREQGRTHDADSDLQKQVQGSGGLWAKTTAVFRLTAENAKGAEKPQRNNASARSACSAVKSVDGCCDWRRSTGDRGENTPGQSPDARRRENTRAGTRRPRATRTIGMCAVTGQPVIRRRVSAASMSSSDSSIRIRSGR